MRMWLVKPTVLCRKHLLGEHLECHMLLGCLTKNKSIKGFIEKGLVQTELLKQRHDELAQEMTNRGYNHKSDMIINFELPTLGKVNVDNSYTELSTRCNECKKRILEKIWS